MNILVIAGIAIVTAAAYAVSLIWHPYVPCRACQGSGKQHDPLWTRAFGDCPACEASGRRPRLGVRLFLAARYRRKQLRGQRR